ELKIKIDELDIEGVTYSEPKVVADMWGEIYAKIVAIYIGDTGKEIRKVFFVSLDENMIE
ncbi:MAG: hypothetical protein IJV71_03220, partial [Lachnospiraceae bacterium]|nr:hypothetical protein [Lachnospiraceae bacterium]